MAKIAAFDMDWSVFRAALFKGSAKNMKVTAFAPAVDPAQFDGETDTARMTSAVRETVKVLGLSKGTPYVAIEAHEALMRQFAVPFTKPDQVRKTIKFQSEGHYHSVSIDALLVEYQPIGVSGSSTNLWCAALRKTTMARLLEEFSETGVNPAAVELNLNSLFTTVTHYRKAAPSADEKADKTEAAGKALIESVENDSELVVISGHKAAQDAKETEAEGVFLAIDVSEVCCRFVLGRGETLLDGRSFRISRAREHDGADPPERLSARITGEIRKTLLSHNFGSVLAKIYYTGTGANKDLVRLFASAFGSVPVEKLDLSRIVDVQLDGETREIFLSCGAVATGLALKGNDVDPMGIDFRKNEFRYERKFNKLKRGLACTMCLLFVTFFVMAYQFRAKANFKKKEIHSMVEEWQKPLFNKMAEGEPVSLGSYLERLQKGLNRRKGTGRTAGIPKQTGALAYFEDFAKQVVRAKIPISWEQATFDSQQCTVRIRVKSDKDGSKIYDYTRLHSKLLVPESPSFTRRKNAKDNKLYIMSIRLTPKGAKGAGK